MNVQPDPEVYLGAAEVLGLQPHEVLMVAAHEDDLDAAAACGLRTACEWPYRSSRRQ